MKILGPLRIEGTGTVALADGVVLGWPAASSTPIPLLLQARERDSRISIGANTRLAPGVQLIARQGIDIGEECLIGPEVIIYDSDFHGLEPENRVNPGTTLPVRIGSRVWIGTRAIVLKGTVIGDGAVVGAGALVTRDVAALSIVAGNPAVRVGSVAVADEPGAR